MDIQRLIFFHPTKHRSVSRVLLLLSLLLLFPLRVGAESIDGIAGTYEIIRELQHSSAGVTFLANYQPREKADSELVALKVYTSEKEDSGYDLVHQKIGVHPNFLTPEFDLVMGNVKGLQASGNLLRAFKMPFFQADFYDLRGALRSQNIESDSEILMLFGSLVDQMLSVLSTLANAGISLGDSHPGNFGYSKGQLLLFDFDRVEILQKFGENLMPYTGHPDYQPPESREDLKFSHSHLHDLYSFGMSLLKGIFGKEFNRKGIDPGKDQLAYNSVIYYYIHRILRMQCDSVECEESKTKIIQFVHASTLRNPVLRAYVFQLFYPEHTLSSLSKQQGIFSLKMAQDFSGIDLQDTIHYNEGDLYLTLKPLGQGGFGSVGEAIRIPRQSAKTTAKTFALKIYRKPRGEAEGISIPSGIEILKSNSALRTSLQAFDESGVLERPIRAKSQSVFFTAHELAEGAEDRLRHLKKEAQIVGDYSLFLQEVLKFVAGVAESLTTLFDSGHIHRDLKTANILYRNNQYVLQDFDMVYPLLKRPPFRLASISSLQLALTPEGVSFIRRWSKFTPGSVQIEKILADIALRHGSQEYSEELPLLNNPSSDLYLFGIAVASLFEPQNSYVRWIGETSRIFLNEQSHADFIESIAQDIEDVPCISDCSLIKSKIISILRALTALGFEKQLEGISKVPGNPDSKVLLSLAALSKSAGSLQLAINSNRSLTSKAYDWCKKRFLSPLAIR